MYQLRGEFEVFVIIEVGDVDVLFDVGIFEFEFQCFEWIDLGFEVGDWID